MILVLLFTHEAKKSFHLFILYSLTQGVIAYKQNKLTEASRHFLHAIELGAGAEESIETWEPTLFNLGHTFRKLKKYDEAVQYYERAYSVCPKKV